LDSAAE
jgi:hypothetical protein